MWLQDALYSPDQLNELVAASDYVVVATPYTPATHQIINEQAINAMKPTAVLVNVGRGKCVDESALVKGNDKRDLWHLGPCWVGITCNNTAGWEVLSVVCFGAY